MSKIVAIGGGEMGRPKEGGGFYPVETTGIDTEVLRLTGKKHPRLLFIPTASYDSEGYYSIVKKHFLGIGCSVVDSNAVGNDIIQAAARKSYPVV